MLKNRQVRIIKRDRRAEGAGAAAAVEETRAVSDREVKTVVSGWVQEHRRRAEEFRQTYTSLLRGAGFTAARG